MIIALTRIKTNADTLVLNNERPMIASQQAYGYLTRNNTQQWFAEMQYKLFKSSESLPNLEWAEKATFLSFLLHAAAHCSDAKKYAIDEIFARYATKAQQDLLAKEEAMANTVEEKMELIAMRKKADVLNVAIENVFQLATKNPTLVGSRRVLGLDQLPLLQRRNPAVVKEVVEMEEATFRAATWDFYSERLGLKKKGCTFHNLRFTLTEDDLFGGGAYSAVSLVNAMQAPNIKWEIEKHT